MMDSLKDLYVEQLRDLYSAETQMLQALPKLEQAASHQELRAAFQEHRSVTERQVERLNQVFEMLGENPKGHHCKGMEGLIKEEEEMLRERGDQATVDAALIAAAQRAEHYEIAGYGTVRTYAERLGLQEQAQLLQQTLDEEGETDHRLTRLAESIVNPDAQR